MEEKMNHKRRKRRKQKSDSQAKWRNISVYCNCVLCKGLVIQSRRMATSHNSRFGSLPGLPLKNIVNEDVDVVSSSADENDDQEESLMPLQLPIDVSTLGSEVDPGKVNQEIDELSLFCGVEDQKIDEGDNEQIMVSDSADSVSDYSFTPSRISNSEEESSGHDERMGKPCDSTDEKEKPGNKYTRHNLYESDHAKLKLYDGAEITVLETLAHYFAWFTEHPMVSKSALSDLLAYNHKNILPSGNNLPKSYQEAYQFIKPFLLETIEYHVCPNDCIIFRNSPRYDYSKLVACPICGENRFTSNRQPARRFIYYPLIPKLQRLYGAKNISSILQSHASDQDSHKDNITDIWQSGIWKEAFSEKGIFQGDARGIALQFSTDGVNPYSANKVQYSMWPVMLSLLNLPKRIRHHYSGITLVGIIPGNGNHEPKHVDPYLEIIVDEVLSSNAGIPTYDGLHESFFELRTEILNFVLDYPGLNKVFGTTGANSIQGCMWCENKGCKNTCLDKVVYTGNRKYLSINHPLRMDDENFPGKCQDYGPPPPMKQYTNLLYDHLSYEGASNQTQAKLVAKGTGCKNLNCFTLIPSHNRTTQAFPDPMHTIPNAVQSLVRLMTGRDDSPKVRKAEQELGRFGKSCEVDESSLPSSQEPPQKKGKGKKGKGSKPKEKPKKTPSLPEAPFRLSQAELKKADSNIAAIRVPYGFDWKPRPFFQKYVYMKSHDWKDAITEGILIFALMDCLGKVQRLTFFKLIQVIGRFLVSLIPTNEDLKLDEEINNVLALVERDFPISVQTISMHLLRHIANGVESVGPVSSWSMFQYERFNSWICRRVTNRRYPEATVMETYKIYDWIEYLRLTGIMSLSKSTGNSCNDDTKAGLSDHDEEPEEYDGTQSNLHCTNELFYRKEMYAALTGRKIVWMGSERDNIKSGRVSSVVGVRREDNVTSFGQIQHFKTNSPSKDVAVLKIFASVKEEQFGLWSVDTEQLIDVSLPLTSLTMPLITAKREQEPNKLWILNFKPREHFASTYI